MFWTVLDFLQKPLAWFSKFYLRVQSKNCGRNGFFCFSFQNFFRFLSKNFSDFWPKNFKKLTKLPSACSDEQFLAWNFFQKFWAVLYFLRKIWHGSQTSIFVSREKIPEEIIFLFFFSDFFRSLSETFFFRFLAKKLQEVVKTNFCVCRRTFFGLGIFLKCFEPFWIFCRNLWHGSQNSIYVSRVKIAEEMVFFCFSFHNFFRSLSERLSDFRPINFKKLSKLHSACADEQNLAWEFFWNVLNRFGFSAETFGMVLKLLSSCPQ